VLVHLEERVERAIHLIHRLQKKKMELESEINQYRKVIEERDAQIQELEARNAELHQFELDLKELREKWEQERREVDREKAEIRERLEGLMLMLNGVDQNKQESQMIAAEPEAKVKSAESEGTEPDGEQQSPV
jgi:chromosome segregation ATPase